jgi:hypothetical protein
MAIERLAEEIRKLTPQQKKELFRKLEITLPDLRDPHFYICD